MSANHPATLFVRDLMERHSKKLDSRRFKAEAEPMTDFGGFDRRAANRLTADEIVTAIRRLPLTVPNLKAVIGAAESMAHALDNAESMTSAMGDVCTMLTDAFSRAERIYVWQAGDAE